MLISKRKFVHYINVLFNVSSHEWPRIILSWLLKMLVHASFVMGSTVLLALFVEAYGVVKLPFLYIISALFVVFGSMLFAFLLERFEKKIEIIVIALMGAGLFLIAPLFQDNIIVFYSFLFIGISVLISQLNIILALFIEELFSPLESERTFPIIESSEPFGGVLAGIIMTFGVTSFHLAATDLLVIIAIVLFLLVPVLLFFLKFANKVPKLESHEEHLEKTQDRFEKTKKGLRHIKGMPFLKGMLVIVFLNFAFISLIEFQYTSVLDAHVVEAAAHNEGQQEDHAHASALTHGLAFWHVMFSLIAFLAQILSASRIHKKLGIVRSMRLHPALNIFAMLAMLWKFGYVTGVASRGIFEITMMMHRTTYHASFYALKRSIREHVKEFMEGIVRPLGIIAGTIVLYLIITYTPEVWKHTAVTSAMLIIMIAMYVVLLKMQKQYTLVAKKNLSARGSNLEKIEAVEVLSQSGHDAVSDILGKNLNGKQHIQIQKKILESLGKIQDVNAIPDILRMFESQEKGVRLMAVDALASYKRLGKHFFSQSFAKHRVVESLEKLFLDARSKKVQSSVVKVFKNINNADIIPFLINVLNSKNEEVVADAIYVCGLFKDINSAFYLAPFLSSENPRIKSASIIALWSFPSYKLKALIQLTAMLEDENSEVKIAGIYALGEIRAVQEIPRLKIFLKSKNEDISCHAAIALAKMEQHDANEYIVQLLLHKKKELKQKTKSLLKNIPREHQKHIDNLLIHEVSYQIHQLLHEEKSTILEKISSKSLQKLLSLYEIISEIKEMIRIEEELKKRELV